MTRLVDKFSEEKVNRRDFLKLSATTCAGLALLKNGNVLAKVGSEYNLTQLEEGKWVSVACWHNCGGSCVNKALVKDGVVVRQKTDDTHPDSPEFFQNRSCPRGRSQQQQVFGADRLKFPMKRKHWEPGGGDKSLRGKDEWERITWDEALDYIADEIERIYTEYGPKSVLLAGYGGFISRIFGSKGGYVSRDGSDSYGTWVLPSLEMGITHANYNADAESANDRMDLVNADTIVLYGCNPVWSSAGSPAYHFWQAKEAGAQFVFVGPDYNFSANLFEAKWIRVRPGTDTAFLLSVAYTMIVEDDPDENPIIDWDFLDRCTVGFDADHLPENMTVNENFKDYVLGEYDGQPKTPEWATEICGTPVEDIRWYARELRKDNKVMLLHTYAAGRCNGAEDLPQLFMTIGAMGGHMGKSGHATGGTYHYEAGNAGPRLINHGRARDTYIPNPNVDIIPDPYLWKAVLDGRYIFNGTSAYFMGINMFAPAEEREIDIRLMYSEGSNFVQSRMNHMDAIKAYRKVDLAVAHAYCFTGDAQYADIVLPVATMWEYYGPHPANTTTFINRETALFFEPVTEPLYESRSDRNIVYDLASRVGLNPDELFPFSEKQQYFDNIAGATVLEPDGVTWVPLVTITEEDIEEWGVDNQPQQGKIGLRELLDRGVYQVERHRGDNYGYIGYEDFVNDPEANPRPHSASGKLEIYCQKKADVINMMYWTKEPFKPYPTYHVPNYGYEQSFEDWDNKVKGEYPFQVFNPHYLRRSHTTLDNVPWLREAWTNPVFINTTDAEERGIEDGDTVLIYNQWGKTLRHATLTETMMPGCLALPHGSCPDVDEETGIDSGGCDNVLLGPVSSDFYVSGFNTCLANIEKYSGESIPPDALKPAPTPKMA